MNAANKTVLVVGATGHLGSAICQLLAKEGTRVQGLVRATSDTNKVSALQKMSVETVEGDLKNRGSLQSALQGVTHVISTATAIVSRQAGDSLQSVDAEGQQHVIEAAVDAGVQQFVYISVHPFPHDFPLQTAKRRTEKRLMESGLPYTILQPTVFMEVWLSPALGFDYNERKATIYGDGKKSFRWISLNDVARYAVASVDNEKAINKTFEIGGPQALTPLEVVREFEDITGKKFDVSFVPQEALEGQLAAAPDDISKSFAGLMLGYAKGYEMDDTPAQRVYGLQLQSVKAYAQGVTQSQPVSG